MKCKIWEWDNSNEDLGPITREKCTFRLISIFKNFYYFYLNKIIEKY